MVMKQQFDEKEPSILALDKLLKDCGKNVLGTDADAPLLKTLENSENITEIELSVYKIGENRG